MHVLLLYRYIYVKQCIASVVIDQQNVATHQNQIVVTLT